jgi:hypothetical protein
MDYRVENYPFNVVWVSEGLDSINDTTYLNQDTPKRILKKKQDIIPSALHALNGGW